MPLTHLVACFKGPAIVANGVAIPAQRQCIRQQAPKCSVVAKRTMTHQCVEKVCVLPTCVCVRACASVLVVGADCSPVHHQCVPSLWRLPCAFSQVLELKSARRHGEVRVPAAQHDTAQHGMDAIICVCLTDKSKGMRPWPALCYTNASGKLHRLQYCTVRCTS